MNLNTFLVVSLLLTTECKHFAGDSAAGRETFIKLMMTEQASTLHFGSYVCTQIFTAVEVLAQAMRHYHITYMSGNSKV